MILANYDTDLHYWTSKGAATAAVSSDDIKILVEHMAESSLVRRRPGRLAHSSGLAFTPANAMGVISGEELRSWVKGRILIASTKHYYKQF